MATRIFPHSDNSAFHVFEAENSYFVNPYDHFEEILFNTNYDLNKLEHSADFPKLKYGEKISLDSRLRYKSRIEAKKYLIERSSLQLPIEIIELLQTRKKKVQQKLLKSITYRSELFVAVPLYAWDNFKMSYTQIIVDFLPKELDEKDFPAFLYQANDNKFEFSGNTNMTKGEMKSAMKKRNRVISEIIGDEKYWHCFFRTMSGIRGHEHPHEGKPHLHYISSAWGISREDIIKQLSSYRYNLKAETIAGNTGEIDHPKPEQTDHLKGWRKPTNFAGEDFQFSADLM